ncbi:hypothetical protein H0H93_013412 [Arthromyces matolae]|nr:hypothetical protein H0H93_013412 [Arthromyces matolae]
MATVSYTIYSHYNPEKRESSACDIDDSTSTLDSDSEPDEVAAWHFDPALKPRIPPPRFVPATGTSSNWDDNTAFAGSSANSIPDNQVSNWYRSLTNKHPVRQSNAPVQTTPSPPDQLTPLPKLVEKKNKTQWFISNVLQSNPETNLTLKTSSSTLADIIARDPPPLPEEQRFKPPVWLEIGPSNKGFAMLQRSGWNEGEALGPNVPRRRISSVIDLQEDSPPRVKRETIETQVPGHHDVVEIRSVDIIDLTSDDDDSLPPPTSVEEIVNPTEPSDGHGGTALLTPIATVLKSDRLGIGLKAKTIGPYKASQKRVTHNAAAMAAHINASAEVRRKKKMFGRGSKGFKVEHQKVEAHRKHLLAYMND